MTRHAEQLIQLASAVTAPLFRAEGRVLPKFHALTSKGEHVIIPAVGNDKDRWAEYARAALRLIDAVAVVFIDEAWIRDATPEDQDEAMRLREQWLRDGIANDPLRKEVVVFNAEDDLGSICGYRPIIRHKGRPHLGELITEIMRQSEGRLVGLLPMKGTAQ